LHLLLPDLYFLLPYLHFLLPDHCLTIVFGKPTFVSKLVYISFSNNLKLHLLTKPLNQTVLIVSATRMEIEPLMEKASSIEQKDEGYFKLNFNAHSFDLLITGVGIPEATFQIASYFALNKISFAIQVGIAGSYKDDVDNGSVVMITEEEFGDIGIEKFSNFGTLFEAGLSSFDRLPYKQGKLICNSLENILLPDKLKKVKGLTINMITSNKTIIQGKREKFNAEVETMESAAFFYCCLKNEIPFLSLRGISNRVGETEKSNWLIKESIQNVCDTLILVLQNNNYFTNET
jgi:futalosine hydrolase